MGNRLFQEARKAVMNAKQAASEQADHAAEAIAIAKNALSSAYAHSNVAEKAQLRQLQEELEQLK
ncbi:DUF3813 domain-containing protein [Anoxybacteroides amylolyticum]|uniref:DUF3813 domain-containing protein n=1 Tax=Anoxybacteroides amylolyticum TaxID=294699 RepID=A0A167TJE7_9BACL|nr:DUF3813 domain-containing protein [Anoxybacillus amylolyticus]ANB61050.1 hypothetical protein GFC30_1097 [Anoxybacillus amylolyticus]